MYIETDTLFFTCKRKPINPNPSFFQLLLFKNKILENSRLSKSYFQVARGLALKKLIKGKHDFRRSATSKINVEKKKNKEIKRTASHVSSVAEASPKGLKSTKQVVTPITGSPLSVKDEKKKVNTPRNQNTESSSPKCTANFILMVELRKNIFAFRDMIDLPSLDGSLSVTEVSVKPKYNTLTLL